jgi:pyrroloquinoline-quinone synthase
MEERADERAWTPSEFHQQLLGKKRSYHLEHRFETMMYAGQLTPEQLRFWVANRFYYQVSIPRKDAAILANCPDADVRRVWTQRIVDHDGARPGEGGIEAWLRLGEGLGVGRDELLSLRRVAPGVRFAVDAYVNFARTAPWQEAVCASLTELFAGEAHRRRLEAFPKHYGWVPTASLSYFATRLTQAGRDVDHGLSVTLQHFTTRAGQERALEILQFKLDVLWAMADAIYAGCVASNA